jgi:hypothetical protein
VCTLIQQCTSTAENAEHAEFFRKWTFFDEFCPPSLAAKTASFGEVSPRFAETQPRT